MSKYLYFVTLLFVLSGCGSYEYDNTYTLVSTTNNTSYKIEVVKPTDYDSSKSYPVVYLLDPYLYIDSLKSIASQYKDENKINDIIIVGIDYTDANPNIARVNDYYYPSATAQEIIDAGITTGGGEKFHTFMKNELIPYIEAKYSCDTTQRTLMGHSAGGYMPLYSLFVHYKDSTTPFTNFVAASPGIFWADGYIIGQETLTSASNSTINAKLYMSYGSLDLGVAISTFYKALDTNIKAHNYSGLSYQTGYFERGHASSMVDAMKNSLVMMFGK